MAAAIGATSAFIGHVFLHASKIQNICGGGRERESERDREKERERSGTSLIFAGKLGLGGCANREHSRFVIKTTVLCDITVGCCSFSSLTDHRFRPTRRPCRDSKPNTLEAAGFNKPSFFVPSKGIVVRTLCTLSNKNAKKAKLSERARWDQDDGSGDTKIQLFNENDALYSGPQGLWFAFKTYPEGLCYFCC